jgi:hypothetical protein
LRFAFKDEAIREICEKSEKAIETYGKSVAKALQSRLADLEASERIDELPTGNPAIMPYRPLSRYKIELVDKWLLILIADHIRKQPMKENDIDWPNVKYVQIFEIVKVE